MISKVAFKGLPNYTRFVSDKLIVGAKQGVFGLTKLKKEEGVTLVIDLCKKKKFIQSGENFICKMLGIKHVQAPMTFSKIDANLKGNLGKIIETINGNTTGRTFIHCRHGKHRSVLVSALVEIKNGRIKTINDFNEFLQKHLYYTFHKRSKSLGKITPKIQKKLKDLEALKDNFLKLFPIKHK